jgi:hypothetical protein
VKRLVLLALAASSLALPALAAAHPLGNFTVNRFSRIEASGPRLYVRYVLDLAEIPTFQAGHIDAHAYARRIARNAHLTVDGRKAELVPVRSALAHPLGAGGLHTTRLEVVLAGPILHGWVSVAYHDNNYRGRIGWKEIVVGAGTRSTSDELRAYPKDLLQSPLDTSSVTARLEPGAGPDVAPALLRGKSLLRCLIEPGIVDRHGATLGQRFGQGQVGRTVAPPRFAGREGQHAHNMTAGRQGHIHQ